MKRRGIWLCALICAAVVLWQFGNYFSMRIDERQRAMMKRDEILRLAQLEATRSSHNVWIAIQHGRTSEEWERIIVEDLPTLAGEDAKVATAISHGKLFEARFRAAESLLVGAGKLLQHDVHHPAAKKYIETARIFYEKNDTIVRSLSDTLEDPRWNAYLNYMRGVHYFRLLLFVKDPVKERSKVEDLIAQSAMHLAKVFTWMPKDNDTEVAIEILQKRAQEMLSAQGSDEQLRLQLKLMPSKEISPEFSIDGGEEGKH